jgi:UDP-N-acetylglucosamine--N-acetylmuramyl-(pentapeptide) pyrophosphoryl-undecaprenol N-acetylglucosamine transferase
MSGGLVYLTAGGTGGHVFPAEALASELESRGLKLALVTDRRGTKFGDTLGRLPILQISAGAIAGRSLSRRLGAVAALGLGFLQTRRLLRRQRPAVLVGFGGYASLPAMMAATMAGIPTVLHEQNAVLGRANRLLASRVTKIATSFVKMSHMTPSMSAKAVRTGMPVRRKIIEMRDIAYDPPSAGGTVRILVIGGSQGARALSQVVPAALKALPDSIRARLDISQQCRPEDLNEVKNAYEGSGIAVTLKSFFDDIPERLSVAHLVITRSGASTIAELTAIGRPSILVPYPHAIDDHQTANAHALDEAGGAWLIPQPAFTAESLSNRLQSLLALPDSLTKAAICARAVGLPDAGARLADLVTSVMGIPPSAAREVAV